MSKSKLLAYIDLLIRLIDAMVDEHIASFMVDDPKQSKYHMDKRAIIEGMLFGANRKIMKQLNG